MEPKLIKAPVQEQEEGSEYFKMKDMEIGSYAQTKDGAVVYRTSERDAIILVGGTYHTRRTVEGNQNSWCHTHRCNELVKNLPEGYAIQIS